MKAVLFLLLIVAAPAALLAQAATPASSVPSLPAGPWVANVTDMDAWVIDYSYGKMDKDAATAAKPVIDKTAIAPEGPVPDVFTALPIRVTMVRTKPYWHVEVEKMKGGKIHQWFDGFTQFIDAPNLGAYMVKSVSGDVLPPGLFDLGNGRLPDLDWIGKENYLGTEEVGGKKCWKFSDKTTMAWIDLENREPVLWIRGNETRTFSRLAPPTAKLQMPESVAKIESAIRQDLKRQTVPNRPRG